MFPNKHISKLRTSLKKDHMQMPEIENGMQRGIAVFLSVAIKTSLQLILGVSEELGR